MVFFLIPLICKVSLSLKVHLRLKSLCSLEDIKWSEQSVFSSLLGGCKEIRRLFHNTKWWHFILASEAWDIFDFFLCADYSHSMGPSPNLSRERTFFVFVGVVLEVRLRAVCMSGKVIEAHMHPETIWLPRTVVKNAISRGRPLGFKSLLCMHQLCDLGQVIQLVFLICKMRVVT